MLGDFLFVGVLMNGQKDIYTTSFGVSITQKYLIFNGLRKDDKDGKRVSNGF